LGFQHFRVFNFFPCHATLEDVSFAFSIRVPTSDLAIAFALDGPRGTDFFNSINPPGKVDNLHASNPVGGWIEEDVSDLGYSPGEVKSG
jgi:hypothetical protein